jgi:uncharacterized protein YjdB
VGCGDDTSLPVLTSIAVSPIDPTVAAGQTEQFTAQGKFSNNTTQDLTSDVTWSSSSLPVATITQGLATTYTVGTTTITAALSTAGRVITGSTALTVTSPDLVSIVVIDNSVAVPGPNPVTATIAKGTSHEFLAYGVYTDGGERVLPNTLTSTLTWSSTPLSVATITNVGRANGISAGTATITATADNTEGNAVSGTATLVVTDATLNSIVVSPQVETIAALADLQFTARGLFSDATIQNITADANWASSDTTKATVSNTAPTKGFAAGVAAGRATISASFGSKTGASLLTVSSASLTSIALTPASSGVAIGSTLLLQAVGSYSDGTTDSINLSAAWTVTPSDNSIATVNSVGLVTGIAAGSAIVNAQVGAVSGTAALNVQDVTSVAITPATPTVAQGTQTQFVATATLADATTQDVSGSVTWVSADPTIATISDRLGSAGWATGITPGTVLIEAVLNGKPATAQLTVTNATLSSLAITSPASPANIALGKSQQYVVTGTFSDSTTQDLTNQVTWTSSDPAVAVIDPSGLATSTGVGTTTVTAAGDINGSASTAMQVLTVH